MPTSLTSLITVLLGLANIAICLAALCIIPGSRKPSTAMAWLILVLAVPFLGLLAFLPLASRAPAPSRCTEARRA